MEATILKKEEIMYVLLIIPIGLIIMALGFMIELYRGFNIKSKPPHIPTDP